MKKYIYSFFLNILILILTFNVFDGVKFSSDLLYIVSSYVAFSLAMLFYKPILKFLTIEVNLITYWLCVSILLAGVFFALLQFMPGFEIGESVIKGIDLGAIKIAALNMNTTFTIIAASVFAGIISSIMEFLKKSE